MKHYSQPETNVLQVINNSIICASGEPAPVPARGQLSTMQNTSVQWN